MPAAPVSPTIRSHSAWVAIAARRRRFSPTLIAEAKKTGNTVTNVSGL